jgi:hypothetical protein
MTVGELREVLADYGDHLTVVIEWGPEERSSDIEVEGGRDDDGMAACVVIAS